MATPPLSCTEGNGKRDKGVYIGEDRREGKGDWSENLVDGRRQREVGEKSNIY